MKKLLLTVLFVSYLNSYAQIPVQEFGFDGTLTNTANTISFMGIDNFVTDRSGNVKSAQRLNNRALEAVIDNLPQGKSARTISIWVKFNEVTSTNYIWGYGTAYDTEYCGLQQQGMTASKSELSLISWGASNDIMVPVPLEKNIWYQYTITYEGVMSKIYRDGKLLKYLDGMSRSTKGNIFRLGEINTTIGINADIDDLKIYDHALTDDQVKELYDSSKPLISIAKAETKNKKINNTTNDVTDATKNIEVYSQGRQIIGNNSMDISDLPEGTYLLKVTRTQSKKITSK